MAKLVVNHLVEAGWEPATDAAGRFVGAEDATRAFFERTDFCYVRSIKRFGGDVAPAHGGLDFRSAPSISARHLVNHFPGEDALTGKARLAAACLRDNAARHPPTVVLAREKKTGGWRVAAGDVETVLLKASSRGGRACVVVVKPSRGACGRGIRVYRLASTDEGAALLRAVDRDHPGREVVVQARVSPRGAASRRGGVVAPPRRRRRRRG